MSFTLKQRKTNLRNKKKSQNNNRFNIRFSKKEIQIQAVKFYYNLPVGSSKVEFDFQFNDVIKRIKPENII